MNVRKEEIIVASPPVVRPAFVSQLDRHSRTDLNTVAGQLIELINEKGQAAQLAAQVTSLQAFIEGSNEQPAAVFQAALPFIKTLKREEAPEGSIFVYGIWNQLFVEANFADRSYHAVTHPGNASSIRLGRIHGVRTKGHTPRRVKLDTEDTADCLTMVIGAILWAFKGFRS